MILINIFVLRKTGFQLRNLKVALPLYARDKANISHNNHDDHMPERSPANLVCLKQAYGVTGMVVSPSVLLFI